MDRCQVTSSSEGKLQQLNQYILKSQERGAEYRESVDELVSPTDIEFVMRLGAGDFDLYEPWFLASIVSVTVLLIDIVLQRPSRTRNHAMHAEPPSA